MPRTPHARADVEGFSLCEFLEWDSQFFNRPIARVSPARLTIDDAARVRSWATGQRVQTVYFLAQLDDLASIAAAESVGFRLVDVRLTYEHSSPRPFHDARIRAVQHSDHGNLERIASHSFSFSRFSRDAAFGPANAARLYREWVRNSIGGWAQQTLVAELQGLPVGFVTCHLTSSLGSIGLIAVAEEARGNGLGPALVLSANSWMHDAGARSVTVVTQGANVQAQRLYQAAGFVTKTVEAWFHLNLDHKA